MGHLLVNLVLHILPEILHFVSVSSKVLDGSINNHTGCIVCILKCDLKALIAFIIRKKEEEERRTNFIEPD